jgi:Phage T7 capsid assembly protein
MSMTDLLGHKPPTISRDAWILLWMRSAGNQDSCDAHVRSFGDGWNAAMNAVAEHAKAMVSMKAPRMPETTLDGEGESEAELSALMRDPRYWRDRDPELIAKVTEGFRRLYPA